MVVVLKGVGDAIRLDFRPRHGPKQVNWMDKSVLCIGKARQWMVCSHWYRQQKKKPIGSSMQDGGDRNIDEEGAVACMLQEIWGRKTTTKAEQHKQSKRHLQPQPQEKRQTHALLRSSTVNFRVLRPILAVLGRR